MIEVIKLVLGGGMVEFHGEFYDFEPLQMSPAPSAPVPFYIGDELTATIGKLDALRAEFDRSAEPFEIQAVCVDRGGRAGYQDLADAGVTDAIVVPWLLEGIGFDGELAAKQDALRRFAEKYIADPIVGRDAR
ncbi:putative oxidoreductase [Mycobacteroides abscessus subsp. abscessus]|nr:putative oxidoreductase [Mycobacteroides abscessus subsp. abscessus]